MYFQQTQFWLTFLTGDVGVAWPDDTVGVVTATGAACVLEVLALVTEAMGFVLSILTKKNNIKSQDSTLIRF